MFCPNCGRDCGNDQFCIICGTKIPREIAKCYAKPEVQSYPNRNSNEPEYDNSTVFYSQLPNRTNTKKGETSIPTSGGYLGSRGSVVLSDSAVSVSTFSKGRTTILYSQLTAVIYVRPVYKSRVNGALLFRGEENKNVPVPEIRKMYLDGTAIEIPPERDTLFYHIFHMLKVVAPPTAKFEMIVPETKVKGVETLKQNVDMDYFWDMYAPHRDRATSGIHAKYDIPKEIARLLVDGFFDDYQKILYKADALDAIRDLNLVVEDMRRAERRANHLDAESRKRREQDDMRRSLDTIALIKLREMQDD